MLSLPIVPYREYEVDSFDLKKKAENGVVSAKDGVIVQNDLKRPVTLERDTHVIQSTKCRDLLMALCLRHIFGKGYLHTIESDLPKRVSDCKEWLKAINEMAVQHVEVVYWSS